MVKGKVTASQSQIGENHIKNKWFTERFETHFY